MLADMAVRPPAAPTARRAGDGFPPRVRWALHWPPWLAARCRLAAQATTANPRPTGTVVAPESVPLGDFLRPQGYTALALRRNVGPHLEVSAKINGVTGRFLVDTGAQITVVDTASLRRFHLSSVKTGVRVIGAVGGPGERIEAALASTLRIGPCETSPFLLGVSDLSALNQGRPRGGGPFDGIIGADVLQNFSFVIDCAGLQLYAKPSGDRPKRRPDAASWRATATATWR